MVGRAEAADRRSDCSGWFFGDGEACNSTELSDLSRIEFDMDASDVGEAVEAGNIAVYRFTQPRDEAFERAVCIPERCIHAAAEFF